MTKNEILLIKKALLHVEMKEVKCMESFPQIDLPHSKQYIENMASITCRTKTVKNKKSSFKKKLLVAVIAALLALLTACALAKPISDLIVEVHEKYIRFSTSKEGHTTITEVYMPTYIPEGYEITSESITEKYVTVYVSNGSYTILYEQTPFNNKWGIRFDTEDVGYDIMYVENLSVYYTVKYNDCMLLWESNDYFFKLRCPDTLSLEEIEKIISGIDKQPE